MTLNLVQVEKAHLRVQSTLPQRATSIWSTDVRQLLSTGSHRLLITEVKGSFL